MIAFGEQIKFIHIALLPCATAIEAEGLLAQASYFTHRLGSRRGVEDVDLIASLIRGAEELIGCQFPTNDLYVYGSYDGCGVHIYLVAFDWASYS